MRIFDFTIRAKNEGQCVLSWTSETEEAYSWIFINGLFVIGPFMAANRDRQMTIPFSKDQAAMIEIHDFDNLETQPHSSEEKPQILPDLVWNCVDEATRYRVYHGDFGDGAAQQGGGPSEGEANCLYGEYPARQGVDYMEIKSPVTLDGQGGHWYWFRVESLDRYNNESDSDGQLIRYFATDLSSVPTVEVKKQWNGLYTFTIGE